MGMTAPIAKAVFLVPPVTVPPQVMVVTPSVSYLPSELPHMLFSPGSQDTS